MAGLLISAIVLACAGAIAWAVRGLHEELRPTQESFRAFGTRVRPALVRVRDTSADLGRRLPRG